MMKKTYRKPTVTATPGEAWEMMVQASTDPVNNIYVDPNSDEQIDPADALSRETHNLWLDD